MACHNFKLDWQMHAYDFLAVLELVSGLESDLSLRVRDLRLDLDLRVGDLGLDSDLRVRDLRLDLDLRLCDLQVRQVSSCLMSRQEVVQAVCSIRSFFGCFRSCSFPANYSFG